MTSQIRRAAVSITSNLAEGFGRRWPRDKARFYDTSLGSLYEVQNQLFIARDVGYLPQDHFELLVKHSKEVQRLISRLSQSTHNRY